LLHPKRCLQTVLTGLATTETVPIAGHERTVVATEDGVPIETEKETETGVTIEDETDLRRQGVEV